MSFNIYFNYFKSRFNIFIDEYIFYKNNRTNIVFIPTLISKVTH